MDEICVNCGEECHIPDEKTGLVHSETMKYGCGTSETNPKKWAGTVASTDGTDIQ